jgi:ubiquinone/menaquinone biosynthesis C-methylase UbiE
LEGIWVDISLVAEDIQVMMSFDIYVDPLLVYTYAETEFESAFTAARGMADTLYDRYVQLDRFDGLGDVPFSATIMRWGLFETILSTAMWISHRERGAIVPDDSMLMQANARLSAYIAHVGIARMYWAYYCILGHDIMHPLYFAKEMSESEFLLSRRHRPYTKSHVELCLLVCLARRIMTLRNRGGERFVALTRHGTKVFEWIHQALQACGYIERRVSVSYVYQFDTVQNWDEMCDIVWPEVNANRRQYIQWTGVSSGNHVLEIGCGTGALTFDAALYQAVGERGMLTAVDISSGMLDQARIKWEAFGKPPQVVLKVASALHLPFASHVFDVVCGSFFLHFVDAKSALREMERVLRPGGTVSVYQPLQTDLDQPFFREWFDPVFQLARRRNAELPETYLPTIDQVKTWFTDCGLEEIETMPLPSPWVFDDPEIVVQHLVRGISFFETELAELPWDDRKTVIAELIARGRDVRRKYPLSERIIQVPGMMVKGTKRMQ